jgi:hypothetical protein
MSGKESQRGGKPMKSTAKFTFLEFYPICSDLLRSTTKKNLMAAQVWMCFSVAVAHAALWGKKYYCLMRPN